MTHEEDTNPLDASPAATGPELAAIGTVIGHKADKLYANALAQGLEHYLGAGEHVVAAFKVNALRPMLDLLVVTSARVAAFNVGELGARGLRIDVPGISLASYDVSRFSRKLTLVTTTGEEVGAGSLMSDKDTSVFSTALDQLLRAPQPVVPGDGSSTRPYLSPRLDESVLAEAEQHLVANERILGLFTLASGKQADILAVTNARMAGLLRRDSYIDLSWSAPVNQLQTVEVKGLTETARVVLETGMQFDVGFLGGSGGQFNRCVKLMREHPEPTACAALAGTNLVGLPEAVGGKVNKDTGLNLDLLSPATKQAIQNDGFPQKHQALVDPMLTRLTAAEDRAAAGDILGEEAALRQARKIAESAGFFGGGAVTKWLEGQVQRRMDAGRLRRGADQVAAIGRSTVIYSDRIFHGDECYIFDGDVAASVEIDGTILESSRPTLTRMAMGSVLPGSALIVGFAVPKKTREDKRSASFNIVHPRWRIHENLDPDRAPDTRGIAAQINAMSAAKTRLAAVVSPIVPPVQARAADPVSPAAPAPSGSPTAGIDEQLAQLERVAAMEAAGHLSAEDAAKMRAKILDT